MEKDQYVCKELDLKPTILLGITGSVASIKTLPIIKQLLPNFNINLVITNAAKHFINIKEIEEFLNKHNLENSTTKGRIFDDVKEWDWKEIGDPVLHIELRKSSDLLLIAPLSANTLAKLANGLCDNLLTCIARAWERKKPILCAPAMNTDMYSHPLTKKHLKGISKYYNAQIIPVVEKKLACGDFGFGAMAEVDDIVRAVTHIFQL